MASISKYATKNKGTLYKVQYRDDSGKNCSKSGFKRASDARAFANEIEHRKNSGTLVSRSASSATVDDYFQLYLQRHMHWSPTTKDAMETAYNVHIKPVFGNVPVARITEDSIQALVSHMHENQKLAPGTIKRVHLVFSSLLAIAVDRNGIRHNPADKVSTPMLKAGDVIPLTPAQLELLINTVPERKRALVLLLATVGLRWGEATALRVSDIDFDNHRITISKTHNRLNGKVVIGKTKTKRTRRVVIPRKAYEALVEYCEGKRKDDIVFPSYSDPKKYQTPPSNVGSWWATAIDKCIEQDPSFPVITRHALRHTAASLMISQGASVLTVQRQLGHATPSTTMNIYSHLYDNDLETLRDIF